MTDGEFMGMEPVELILVGLNLSLGVACAVPLARVLAQASGLATKVFRCFAILVGVYFVESAALVMGMGIPVFNVCLAVGWGLLFGLYLRGRASPREVLKTSTFLSLYTSLPALSFIIIPVFIWAGGGSVLSSEAGRRFGIPDFLPWPVTTILGFYGACAVGAVVLKSMITISEISFLLHFGRRNGAKQGSLVGSHD